MRVSPRGIWLWPGALLAAACSPAVGEVVVPDFDAEAEIDADPVDPEILAQLEAGYPVDVIVMLDGDLPHDPLARSNPGDDTMAGLELRAPYYAAWRDDVIASVGPTVLVNAEYTWTPAFAATVEDVDGLLQLLAQGHVSAVVADRGYTTFDAESLDLVDQPEAVALGWTGAGKSVAVLDTGADWTHADLGSCTAVNTPSACRVVYAQDFAPSDGQRDVGGHGSNVSAIVAKTAPGADIIALDVFRSDGMGYTSDIISAIDWVITNRATYNIVAMNLSLGGGAFTATCGSDAFATPIANAKTAGVVAAIATGNNGYTNKIASPACVPAAVRVGAVYDSAQGARGWSGCSDSTTAADKVTCFSNSASFITLLGPGAMATAGGYTMGGTSQATPHVAGAFAVVAQAFPDGTPDDWTNALKSTGKPVTDARNGVVTPRIDIEAAVLDATGDNTAPTGSITIAGGAAWTKSTSVAVTLAATDDSGSVSQMCVSTTATCKTWEAYATSKTVVLPTGNGTKTLYAWFKDADGNTTGTLSDTIGLDVTAPTGGKATLTRSGSGAVTLAFSGVVDANSGVASYRVARATGLTAPKDCTTTIGTSSSASYADSGLTNGTTYAWRVCPVDAAGNSGLGFTITGSAAPETTAPTGTVSINAGATITNNPRVTLTLAATDASTVSKMCVSNTTTCTAWTAYKTSYPWGLAAGNGTKTVYVSFQDQWGNSSAAVTDTIAVDNTKPVDGTVTLIRGDRALALTWTGFSDANSGIAKYIVKASTVALAGCTTGTTVYEGTSTEFAEGQLTNGTLRHYRVCAVDVAGNISIGKSVSGIPAPELIAPTGTVTLSESRTKKSLLPVTLSATDASGVTQMCLSTALPCTRFVAYATTANLAVPRISGNHTVYAVYRDKWSNEGKATASLFVDITPPVDGKTTITAAASGSNDVLTWLAAKEAHTTVTKYKVVAGASTSAVPKLCSAGTVLYEGTALTATVTGAAAGKTQYYRVCAQDELGNWSAGATGLVKR